MWMRCGSKREHDRAQLWQVRRTAVRGIILAGDCAGGLCPREPAHPKSLLPVDDKPLIYHPLSLLLLAGIRHILIISTPQNVPRFQQLLGGGAQWGINLSYAIQPSAGAPAQAFIIASEFIGGRSVALTLGHPIFYGRRLAAALQNAAALKKGARLFVGAAAGLYFYDNTVAERARTLKPSNCNASTLTDLHHTYRTEGTLTVEVFDDNLAALDIDTDDSLEAMSKAVKAIEERPGVKTGCPEAVARRMGFIDDEPVRELAAGVGHADDG